MATGAGDLYWERQGLPRVFKHDLLGRHLPKFGGKTGSKSARVVYLDGYAGRGRYDDGTLVRPNLFSGSPKISVARESSIASFSTRQIHSPTLI